MKHKQRTRKPHTVTVKTVRFICRAAERHRPEPYTYPSINLAGRWLAEAGYSPGTVFTPVSTPDGDLLLKRT